MLACSEIRTITSSFYLSLQEKFLADQRNPIEVRVDAKFDTNDDFIEKISLISKNRFAIALNSGKAICL